MSTVEELDQRAQALRAQGLKYREIAERMGETKTHAWTRCNRKRKQEHNARSREINREHRRAYDRLYNATHKGTCSNCGGNMDRNRDGGVCQACRHDEHDRKAQEVERLWAEGKTTAEICAAMGWTKNMFAASMDAYRAEGYDLPYRYRGSKNGSKFPHLRKAA